MTKLRSLRWALIQYGPVLVKRGNLDKQTVMHTGEPHVNTKTETDAPTTQGRPKTAGQPPEARGEAWNRPPLTASEGMHPANAWILDFQSPERQDINVYFLSHSVGGTWVWQPWQTGTGTTSLSLLPLPFPQMQEHSTRP